MSTEGFAYGERSPAPERRPAYGESRLAYEADREVEESLHRRVELRLAVAIVAPVLAAYAAVGYAFYVLASALF